MSDFAINYLFNQSYHSKINNIIQLKCPSESRTHINHQSYMARLASNLKKIC